MYYILYQVLRYCWIGDGHSGGYEDFCILGYNAVLPDESQDNYETSMKQASCLGYFSNLKMEVICANET
jgi:hypothetical protein